MSEQWQLRRGTTAENDNFTGAAGEVTMDTDTGALRVHDGVTTGGKGLVDSVVEFQLPTADNNYTWYRKYASGWVEQGQFSFGLDRNTTTAVTLPVEMADTNYTGQISGANTTFATASTLAISALSATQVNLWNYNGSASMTVNWEVKGMAA